MNTSLPPPPLTSYFLLSQNIGEKIKFLIPDWTYFHCPGATLTQDIEATKAFLLLHVESVP